MAHTCPKCKAKPATYLYQAVSRAGDPPADGEDKDLRQGDVLKGWMLISPAKPDTEAFKGWPARWKPFDVVAIWTCVNPECDQREERPAKVGRCFKCGAKYPELTWYDPSGCPCCSKSFVD